MPASPRFRIAMISRFTSLAAVALATLAAPLPSRAAHKAHGAGAVLPTYTFTRIASRGDAAPGAEGGSYAFDFEAYGLNARGQAAFAADVSTGGEGVFVATRGHVAQIARSGEPAPGGGVLGGFGVFGNTAINDPGDVAFVFSQEPFDPRGIGAGVYRYQAATHTLSAILAPGVTPAPGGGVFAGSTIHASINNDGDAVFPGIVHTSSGIASPPSPPGNDLGVGVFRATELGVISSVVSPGDPAPGGGTFDFAENPWINDHGDVAFGAHVSTDPCIDFGVPQSQRIFCGESVYLRHADGTLVSIAHQGDPAPGGGTYRLAFGPMVNNRGDVVFIGDLTAPPGFGDVLGVFLYSASSGTVSPVARPGDALPGGDHLVRASGFVDNYSVNSRGDVAFDGVLDTQSGGTPNTGLYVWSQGKTRLVARTGTTIPGVGTIASISNPGYGLGSATGYGMLNERGEVLFTAILEDDTPVILVATPHGGGTPAAPAVIAPSNPLVAVGTPSATELAPVRPMPVRDAARIGFTLAKANDVSLRLYDLQGRVVATLVTGFQPAGSHEVALRTTGLSPGVYMLRFSAGEITKSHAIVVAR